MDNHNFDIIKQDIQKYIDKTTAQEIEILAKTVLRAGHISLKEQKKIDTAFEWVLKGEIEKALKKLKILDDLNFYKAAILLLLMESQRQKELPADKKNNSSLKKIIYEIERTTSSYPGLNFSISFIVWWASQMIEVMSLDDLLKVLGKCYNIYDTDNNVISPVIISLVKQFIKEGNFSKTSEMIKLMVTRDQLDLLDFTLDLDLTEEPEKIFSFILEKIAHINNSYTKANSLQEIANRKCVQDNIEWLKKTSKVFLANIDYVKEKPYQTLDIILNLHKILHIKEIEKILLEYIDVVKDYPEKEDKGKEKIEVLSKTAHVYHLFEQSEKTKELLDKSIKTLKNMPKTYHIDGAVHAIATTMAHVKMFSRACKILEEYKNNKLDYVLEISIKQYIEQNNFEQAINVYHSLKHDYLKEQILSLIAEKYDISKVIELSNDIKHKGYTSILFTNLAKIAEKQKNFSQARDLLQKAFTVNNPEFYLKQNIINFELRCKKFTKALELVDTLKIKTTNPESKLPSPDKKDELTPYILLDIGETALDINEKTLQSKIIDKVLKKIDRFELDESNKTRLAYILGKYGDLKAAYTKLQEIILVKCSDDLKKYEGNVLNAEIPIQCKSGNWEKALKIGKPSLYISLTLEELIKNNQFEKSLSLIANLNSEWSKNKIYRLFVDQLLIHDLSISVKFVQTLPDYAKAYFLINSLKQIKCNSSLFNTQLMNLITKQINGIWFNKYKSKALAKLGEVLSICESEKLADSIFEQAQQCTGKIELPWQKASSVSNIAYYIQKNNPYKSKELFDKSFKILDEFGQDYYKCMVFPQIARDLFNSGYREQAKDKFCETLKIIAGIPRSYVRSNLTKGFCDCLMEINFDTDIAYIIDEFCKIADRNEDKDESMQQFAEIITTLIHWKQIDRAVSIANHIDSKYYDVFEMAILRSFLNIKNYPKQLEFFEKFVKDIASSGRHMSSRIAALHLKTGNFENMIAILRTNKNAQENLIDVVQEFKNIKTITADRKILNELLQMAIKDQTYMMHTLNCIINAIAKSQHLDLLPEFINKNELSHTTVADIVIKWQYELIKNLPQPVKAVKNTFTIFPFDYGTAYHGLKMLRLAYLKESQPEKAQIIENVLLES